MNHIAIDATRDFFNSLLGLLPAILTGGAADNGTQTHVMTEFAEISRFTS